MTMQYESTALHESATMPGVRFRVVRMSFARRLELMKTVRDLTRKQEFCEAGSTTADQIDAAIAAAEIDRAYLEWGLAELEGLEIDGQPANKESLIEAGPEKLCAEIATAVKAGCGLSEQERKN